MDHGKRQPEAIVVFEHRALLGKFPSNAVPGSTRASCVFFAAAGCIAQGLCSKHGKHGEGEIKQRNWVGDEVLLVGGGVAVRAEKDGGQ